MVWDLGKAMHRKQEFECARLIDFEFRLRARTMRRLAQELGMPAGEWVEAIALGSDEDILARLADRRGEPVSRVDALHRRLQLAERARLIGEIGDPTPCRLG